MDGPLTARQLIWIIAGCAVIVIVGLWARSAYQEQKARPSADESHRALERNGRELKQLLNETGHYGQQ